MGAAQSGTRLYTDSILTRLVLDPESLGPCLEPRGPGLTGLPPCPKGQEVVALALSSAVRI